MTVPPTQRKLSAILHADVVGFSRLMEADEEQTHRRLSTALQRLITAIKMHSGRVIKTAGDAVLAEFPSVVEAVRAAVSAQRGFAEENRRVRGDQRLAFRIGINLGDVIIDGDDIFGDGVNVAARLESLADPGGICISATVFDHVSGKVDVSFADLGDQRLKNIERPIRAYRVVLDPDDTVAERPRQSSSAPPRRRRLIGAALALLLASAGVVGWWIWPSGWQSDILRPSEALSARPVIAVLPFANLGGAPGDDPLSDGITEDLIGELGRFNDLAVLGTSAVFPLKQTSLAPAEIGRELGVQFLVQGSLRASPDRMRINIQLTDAHQGRLLWSEQFDIDRREILVVQQQVAGTIAGKLAASLDRAEERRALAKPIEKLDAYDRILRARALLRKGERAANREARQLLESAIKLSPDEASAHGLLAEAFFDMVQFGWTEFPDQILLRVEEEAKRAVALDENNPTGHRLLGRVYVALAQYERGLAEIDRAIALNPSDGESLKARASALLWTGKTDAAITAAEAGFRFDPAPHPSAYLNAGLAYYLARRFEDCSHILERGLVRFPQNGHFLAILAAAYAQMGDSEQAARVVVTLRQKNPFFDPATFGTRLQKADQLALLREGLRKAGLEQSDAD